MDQKKKKEARWSQLSHPSGWLNFLVIALTFFVLTASMVMAISPERFALSVGDIAPKTITATKDIVDEITTERRREYAAGEVPLSYKEDAGAVDRVMLKFERIFRGFEEIRKLGAEIYAGAAFTGVFSRADLDRAKTLTPEVDMSDWQLGILMKQTRADLESVRANTGNILNTAMQTTIRQGQEEAAISNIQRQVVQTTSSDMCYTVAMPAVRASIEANMVVDQAATEAAREEARGGIEPAIYKSGQNIIVAGERVTAAQRAVLDSLGLIEGTHQDLMMISGAVILGILVMISLVFHVLQFDKKRMRRTSNTLMLATISLVTMGVCLLAAQVNPYLAPVSMMVLLVSTVLSPTLALTANLLGLIIVGVLTNTAATFTNQMLNIVFAGMLSAPVGVYVSCRKQMRASVLLAGFAMAIVNFFSMIAIGLLTNNEFATILNKAVWSAGGNVLAAVLSMGAQPILEWAFGLVTPYKLLELANPSQPLLRRLLVETPGTYHHSILVANLAEAAAEAIGANALLARVGAYYHDIGKLMRPLFFRENQLNENPHDLTDPRVSAAIIAEHVADGIEMARKARLPQKVIDFISTHHGDTQISFFYQKMRAMPGGETARIENFQYPGPKPRTAETAILMLADTVEAAVRAGGDQEPAVIEAHIRELVKDKIDGGQLNESPLRFADVSVIIRAFAQVLTGIYHKRIEYPQPSGFYALPIPRSPAIRVEQASPAQELPGGVADEAPVLEASDASE